MRNFVFELLYPIYLLKFRRERDYIAARLARAGLRVRPKEVYRNLFLNGLDSLRFLRRNKPPLVFENLQLAQSELQKGGALVFASIHLGAFEMLHRSLSQLAAGRRVNLLVAEFRNKRLDNFLTKARAATNINIVKDYDKVLKHAIKGGEIIATMIDQSRRGGESFPILGDIIPLFLKLPLTAKRLGASLVFFRTFRRNGVHVLRFERVYAPESEINTKEIALMVQDWVMEYPEQWTWNYPRIRI